MANGIDGILAFFEQHSVVGMMNLQPQAEWLLYMFAILDISMTSVMSLDTTKYTNIIHKFYRYGLFLFIIRNFQDVANMLFKTFATAGSVAASGTANAVVLTPGAIWNKGFETVGNLFGQIFSLNPFTSGFGIWFLTLIAIIFCAIATFQMVFQFLEMKIEFCIFSSVAIFFIPFSCLSQLNFLFQRILTGFFSSLTKIMVMYFMLALVQSEISQFVIESGRNDVSLDTVNMALRFMVMGLLVAKLPQFAAGIISGSASMGGSIGSFASGLATAPLAGAALATGGVQQYKDRLAQGQSYAGAKTVGAVTADLLNKAAGDPAGKIWFPNYDRGRSQSLRRGNPFENTPKQQNPSPAQVKEERFQLEADTAKRTP